MTTATAPRLDGLLGGALSHPKTRCLRGHPRTPENLTKGRSCRVCQRQRNAGLLTPSPRTPAERFWAHVQKTPTCWLWTGLIPNKAAGRDYGSIVVNKRQVQAHRFSYELNVGPIPVGMMLCHRCDTPRCVNPEHLFPGTGRDNVQDSIAKGRRIPQRWLDREFCFRGKHRLTDVGIEDGPHGRRCRACRKESGQRSHAKRKHRDPRYRAGRLHGERLRAERVKAYATSEIVVDPTNKGEG